jgi:GNAT superfamily N-acetyltransferase
VQVTIMDMHVRLARAGDRERMLSVWERSVRATHHFLAERDIIALRPLVAIELASTDIGWWVVGPADAAPIGFLGFARATIEALFIDPDCHRQGAGGLLVAHAQRMGGSALAVDVNEQNADARQFYEALGFAVVGRSRTDAGGRPFPILHMRRAAVTPAYDIGLATPDDLAALPAIENAAARLFAGHVPDDIPGDATASAVFEAAQADGRLWVARHEGRPVGFAHVTILEPSAAHLEELDVNPEHGRRGIGRRLVLAVCEWAAARGLRRVTLTTFRDVPFNRPFYESLGFEVVSPDQLGPALSAVAADEARRGLDIAPRVAMRRLVDGGRVGSLHASSAEP